MGMSVSLPAPFSAFSRLSLGDVDAMIVRHRKNLDGAFMVTPAELGVILGPNLRGEAPNVLSALEAGAEGKVNALTFLCGAVAMCRVAPDQSSPGKGGRDRGDGVKDKARRLFALFDFSRGAQQQRAGLLSLGAPWRPSWGSSAATASRFVDMNALDHAARIAVKRYDSALRRGVAERTGWPTKNSGDDVDLGAADSFAFTTQKGSQEAVNQPRLPRKDFVEWTLRSCRRAGRPSSSTRSRSSCGPRAAISKPAASRRGRASSRCRSWAPRPRRTRAYTTPTGSPTACRRR